MDTPEVNAQNLEQNEQASESPAAQEAVAVNSTAPESSPDQSGAPEAPAVLADDASAPSPAEVPAPAVEEAPESANPIQIPAPAAPVVPEPPAAEPEAPEIAPGHIFTGKIVRVHVAVKDCGTFDHAFNVSSEPLVEIINRFCKAKHGVDLSLLPGVKLHINGQEVAENQQAHLLGIEDEDLINVNYD